MMMIILDPILFRKNKGDTRSEVASFVHVSVSALADLRDDLERFDAAPAAAER